MLFPVRVANAEVQRLIGAHCVGLFPPQAAGE